MPDDKKEIQRPFIEPGFYPDLPNEEYHGSGGVSSSVIKTLMTRSPAHLFEKWTHPTDTTPAMQLGTATHTLTMEPHKFDDDIAVAPDLNMRTKAGKAEREIFDKENEGKAIITPDQFKLASAMAESVQAHPMASLLLDNCMVEPSIYWWYKSTDPDDDTHYKLMAKVRPDSISKTYPLILDLKTTQDASYSGFMRTVMNFYYHLSAAMYMEGVNQNKELLDLLGHHAITKFVLIVVESAPPHAVAVYELSAEFLALGKHHYRNGMLRYYRGKENNFPAYPEEIRVLEPPPWASRGHIV